MTALAPYRQFLLLAAQPGWQATATALTADADGAWRLDALAGNARPLAVADDVVPAALACPRVAGDGVPIVVLDAASQRIDVIDPAAHCPIRRLAGVGGHGDDGRRFQHASDIAVLRDGALAVADTGHGSVKLFGPFPHALLAVYPAGRPTRLVAGAGDTLWLVDADGARVFSLDREGTAGAALPGLTAPVAVAAGPDGTIAVVDGGEVKLFVAGTVTATFPVPDATAVTFGSAETLYAGTGTGLIYGFAGNAAGWRATGVGVLGQTAAIARLAWRGATTLLAVVQPTGVAAQLWQVDTAGAFVRTGSLVTDPLDSDITSCVWHRIELDADLPAGTAIEVITRTYDDPAGPGPADVAAAAIVLAGGTDGSRDCLIQSGPGRYLDLTLTLRGDGIASPVVRGVHIWFPRAGWLNQLPAVFREDDESASFLSRFLSILQTDFDGFDATIDTISRYFDPAAVPDAWFAWLAAWIALPIEPSWTNAQRRAVLKSAFVNYARRGTPAGLEQLVADYAGVATRLVEHFRLRQLIVLPDDPARAVAVGSGRLWSRDFYRRLQLDLYSQVGMFKLVDKPEPAIEPVAWGANEFSVFFDTEPLALAATRKKVAAVIEREKPAHTMATYRPVYPRMRIGVQATLGVDTRVGAYGEAVLCQVATLGYDAVLAPSPPGIAMRKIHAPVTPRLGVNTRLS